MMIDLPPELEGEYTVRVIDMPTASPGFVICDEDNHYNVYLNARYTRESNANTALHELTHAINDDFHNADPIQTVESRAASHSSHKPLSPLIRASDLPKAFPSAAGAVQGKVAAPTALTDEVASPRSPVPLTPHQTHVLLRCLRDLDACFFSDPYEP